jgi:PAS domain S-box-containing protein
MVSDLFQNLILLIGLSVLYWVFAHPLGISRRKGRVYIGLWFGLIAIAVMMMPFEYQQGAIFDGRSIILTLAGLFGGLLPGLISGAMAAAFRIYLGGSGIYAGIATIVSCVAIGLYFRWRYSGRPENIKLFPLFGIGILVHLVMLACQLLFPWPMGLSIISMIWMPVMLFFPMGFVLIGFMLSGIDKRLLAEQQLKLAEYKYRNLFNSIQDAIVVTDTNRKILNCNKAFTEHFGYTLDEIKGKDTLILYQNEEQYKILGKGLKTEDITALPLVYTVRFKRKDGSVFPGETSLFFQNDEEGQLFGYIGLIRDVSSKRSAEEKFRIAFKTSPDSISINRLSDGLFVEINQGFTRITGFTEEDVMGKTSYDISIWADANDRNKLISGLKQYGLCGKSGSEIPDEGRIHRLWFNVCLPY